MRKIFHVTINELKDVEYSSRKFDEWLAKTKSEEGYFDVVE